MKATAPFPRSRSQGTGDLVRPFLHFAIVAALSSVACNPSHAIAVINRTDRVIEQVQVTVGEHHARLGGIGPGVHRVFIFYGRLAKDAVVEWKDDGSDRRASVSLRDVPSGFGGTINLEVMKDATLKLSLRQRIPGL